jgi:hypothetical protein
MKTKRKLSPRNSVVEQAAEALNRVGESFPIYAGTNASCMTPQAMEVRGLPTNGTPNGTPAAVVTPPALLKLDLGCGSNKREGFAGVDTIAFPGVDHCVNLAEPIYRPIPAGFEWMAPIFERRVIGYKQWPWADSSVSEAHSSHFIEHLTSWERVHFVNELHRILVPGGKCQIIVPHWASCRAYGDPSHQWGPASEFWFYYLSREWRLGNKDKGLGANAPHTDIANNPLGFNCDFEAAWGYGLHPQISLRNQEAQQFAMQFYKEAVTDIVSTLTCRK